MALKVEFPVLDGPSKWTMMIALFERERCNGYVDIVVECRGEEIPLEAEIIGVRQTVDPEIWIIEIGEATHADRGSLDLLGCLLENEHFEQMGADKPNISLIFSTKTRCGNLHIDT